MGQDQPVDPTDASDEPRDSIDSQGPPDPLDERTAFMFPSWGDDGPGGATTDQGAATSPTPGSQWTAEPPTAEGEETSAAPMTQSFTDMAAASGLPTEPQEAEDSGSVDEGVGPPTGTAPGDDTSASPLPSWGADDTASPSVKLEPGQIVFDKYLVVRKIGEGGMGTVWLVRHRELGIERAVKMIVAGIATDAHARARLRREAQVMALFTHPNAVAVHDARMTRDAAFIEMEYVRGKAINSLLEPGTPMPLDWTARILTQLGNVLQVAHNRGIVHRDLKPSNLMLVEGQPPGHDLKVLDFGIAKLLGSDGGDTEADDEALKTGTGVFIGTVQYASPEQVMVAPLDGRSDLYAVGVILYEFLSGFRPFNGPRAIYDHVNTPPPPMAERNPKAQVPPAVEAVVLRCLAKQPEDRPQSALELVEEFQRALPPHLRPVVTAGGSAGFPYPLPKTGRPSIATPPPTERDPANTENLPRTEPMTAVTTQAPPGRVGWRNRAALVAMLVGLVGGGTYAAIRTLGPSRADLATVPSTGGDAGEVVALTPGPPPRPEPPRFPPAGYAAVEGGGYLGRLPRVLEREADQARFILMPGGEFTMGGLARPGDPYDRIDDIPAHPVRLSPFYIQDAEVNYGEFRRFLGEKGLSMADHATMRDDWDLLTEEANLAESEADKYPVVGVSHKLASEFARWAHGRLPTEAQWEYAARSGGQPGRRYVWSEDAEPDPGLAHINAEVGVTRTVPGRSFAMDRTDQDVFDMTGNVREWCADMFAPYSDNPARRDDPSGPLESDQVGERVIRGGSYYTDLIHARTTYRSDHEKAFMSKYDLGFRIAIPVPTDLMGDAPRSDRDLAGVSAPR